MSLPAVLHAASALFALAGLAAFLTPAARRQRGHPMTVLIALLLLLLLIHTLSIFKGSAPRLDRLTEFSRLMSPVLWFFLIYSWLQTDASRRFTDSESRFRQFMEHSPTVAFLKDAKGRYVFGNRAWAAQFNAEPSDLLGKTDADLWSPETAEQFKHSDDAARRGEVVVLEESGQRDTPDHPRWFEVRKFPVPGPDGVLVGGVVMEVTARKQALAEAAAAAARYRLMFERNPLPMWVFDRETLRFLDVNPAAVRHYGYSRDEFLSMTLRDVRPPEDITSMEAAIRNSPSDFSNEGVWRHRKRDGTIIFVQVYNDELVMSGRRVKLAVLQDVTDQRGALEALKESQFHLERAQAVAHVGSWWSDPSQEGGRLVWSKETCRICGISEEKFDGRVETFFNLVHPGDLERVKAASRETVEGGKPFNIDHRIVRPDGRVIWVHEQAELVRDQHGGAARLIGICQDITARMEAQQQREQLEAELAQVRRLETVGTLAAGVAHDFSNLLTAAQGHIALADRSLSLDHAARKSLRMVEKVVQQGISMTRNLLTFAHQASSSKQPTNIAESVADAMQLFRHLMPGNIDLSTDVPDDPVWVLADRTQLQQVLMNLLLNARDAMPKGGSLKVSVDTAASNGSPEPQARLTVADTGTGMDAATLERIFEPFFTTKPRGKGSGLGLAMVHGIVTDHGGRITASSTPGAGTRFEIVLPQCPPPADFQREAPAAAPVAAPRKRTILLAAPDDFTREIIVTALESAGYPVRLSAPAPEWGVELHNISGEVGAVIVDLDAAPPSDDPLAPLRRLSEAAPLIVLTANSAVFLDEPVSQHFQFLPKPFQMSQLIERVDRALGISKAGE